MSFYVDTSAFLKLAVAEEHSAAMRRWAVAHQDQLFSSDLLVTEARRAARRHSPEADEQVMRLLGTLLLVRLGPSVFERAATLEPMAMRSLDALHLAAAMAAGDDLAGIVTYDERLASAATACGVAVAAPT